MNRTFKLARFATLAAAVVTLTVPAFAARGKADFTRYVALGDSYGAGISNLSLVESHQRYSFPAVIARQARAVDFQQPLVSQPGITPELQLLSLAPLTITPKASTNGSPINLSLPRPYNNLSIPGARVADLLTLTGAQSPVNTATTFAQFILRGRGTAVDQALALNPTFVSLFVGGNDVLSAALDGSPATLTPLADFTRDYNRLLDRLVAGAPQAGMVVGGIGDVTALPFASTIPPFLVNPATNLPVAGPDGNPIFFVADLGGGTIGQLTPGSRVLLSAAVLLATGFGIPSALKPLFPTLPDVGKPLPDFAVLTVAETNAINTRAAEVNAAIKAAAAARDIPFVNNQALLDQVRVGANFGGVRLSTAFLTGGVFGYDGFHPTDIGYTLIANEFIKTINAAYKTRIAQASLVEFFSNNAPVEASSVYVPENAPFLFDMRSALALWEFFGIHPGVGIGQPAGQASE